MQTEVYGADKSGPCIAYGSTGPMITSPYQELVTEAIASRDPLYGLSLAKHLLENDPENIDLRRFLAERAWRPEVALEHLQAAVDAGDRIWHLVMNAYGGPWEWWTIAGTRPYMRVMSELADVHHELGNDDAAREIFERLLTMNPDDDLEVQPRLDNLNQASSPNL